MSRRIPRVADALADWIPLVDASGPFLTLPVLRRAFPNGMPRADADVRADMRQRLDALVSEAPDAAARAEWLRWVLRELLAYGPLLREGTAIPEALQHHVPEQGITLRPDFALVGPAEDGAPAGRARLLIEAYERGVDFTKRLPDAKWTATPVERMALLCRATGVELGLLTDTNAYMLVWAPRGGTVATATWLASLWSEERGLFESFVALLGARRFFAVAAGDTLEALFAESATAQIEVTNQLGKQVRQAVELLVDAFSRANRESEGQLLDDLGAGDLETAAEVVYSAAVTVMMRLVFLLCAEERRLFPVGEALYDESYAVSTMLDALQEESSLFGEETLERRMAAWNRLLATFRLVHDGVQHETLRIPAYGGTLFDPDRYPFLEGRRPGRLEATGAPPAITDRSVMAILKALQYLTFKGETRRVSYRALDVEQIGHVYEGLLDHGCQVVDEVLLGFDGRDEPELSLRVMEAKRAEGADELVAHVAEHARRSASAVARDLKREMDADTRRFLLEACENAPALFERVAPFVGLLRRDLRGLPAVYLPGAVCMTQTSSRRDSGTEYTTRELADEVVRYTLEPLVYSPGPQDGANPEEWRLKTSREILHLKVCDPAVGSGAILVAACRYLADRLFEAWVREGAVPSDASADPEAVVIATRRAVVDHCLYGVDRNPMAAEMAKLSLWLVTMAKERPFSFLDHAIQSGDSLLGLTSMEQLTTFHIDPARGREMNADLWGHASAVRDLAARAMDLYQAMADVRVVTVRDAEEKARLHREATSLLEGARSLADAIVAAAVATAPAGSAAADDRLSAFAAQAAVVAAQGPEGGREAAAALRAAIAADLAAGAGTDTVERRPLHWPLAFPEVFLGTGHRGFNAVVGNPPFLGGTKISGPYGRNYRYFLAEHVARRTTNRADLVAFFFLRAAEIASRDAVVGLLATSSLTQGDSRDVSLGELTERGWTIVRAVKSRPWPGSANLEVSQVWLASGVWAGAAYLDGQPVDGITPGLDIRRRTAGPPVKLAANADTCFEGVKPLGIGFVLDPEEAEKILQTEPSSATVLAPYLSGEDVTSRPDMSASRFIINFGERTEAEARRFTTCWQIAEERVRPERIDKDAVRYPRMVHEWWKFWRPRPEIQRATAKLECVIVVSRVSKAIMPAVVSSNQVLSDRLAVVASDSMAIYAQMASTLHWWWVVEHGSKHETRPTFSPTCFETFPRADDSEQLASLGRQLLAAYRAEMVSRGIGLTDVYNDVNDETVQDPGIVAIREVTQAIDAAVVAAHRWRDIQVVHGFFPTSQGLRFTLEPTVRREVLERLLELNHARHAEEVRLGLHEPRSTKSKAVAARARGGRQTNPVDSNEQIDLLPALDPASTPTKRKR